MDDMLHAGLLQEPEAEELLVKTFPHLLTVVTGHICKPVIGSLFMDLWVLSGEFTVDLHVDWVISSVNHLYLC